MNFVDQTPCVEEHQIVLSVRDSGSDPRRSVRHGASHHAFDLRDYETQLLSSVIVRARMWPALDHTHDSEISFNV